MARTPATFKQSDVTRAVKAVQAAGVTVGRIEIDPATGKIVIFAGSDAEELKSNEWDEVL